MRYAKDQAKEACREQVRGVWAAITTPFAEDGALDENGLRANVAAIADEFGVDGVFCGGAIGEFWALTLAERRRVTEIVVDAAQGRCGVIAHTGHHCLAEAIELTRHAQEAGADFAASFTPYYPRVHEPGIAEYFSELAANVDIGLWLIDTGMAGQLLSIELTDQLAAIDNICGLKIVRADDHLAKLERRIGDRMVLSSPVEGRWLERIRAGHTVFMSDASPFLIQPRGRTPLIDYTSAAFRGSWEEAEAIAAAMHDRRQLFERLVAVDVGRGVPPTPWIKAWSARMGLAAGPTRPPAYLPGEELASLHQELDRLLDTESVTSR